MSTSHLLLCFVAFLGTALGAGTAPHDINCVNHADGLHEIGCWGYANCVGGKPDIHACGAGTVLDRKSMNCVKPGEGQTDCFLPADCKGKPDASYADYGDKCISYYRCINQINLGRFYCPQDTAFNENLQLCDYPRNLPAPCGTNGQTVAPITMKTQPPSSTGRTTTPMPTTTTTTTTTTMPTTTSPMPTTVTTQTTTMPTTTTTPTMTTTSSQPTTTDKMTPKMTSQIVLPVVG